MSFKDYTVSHFVQVVGQDVILDVTLRRLLTRLNFAAAIVEIGSNK
jgi:hypothetical protein